MTVLIEGDLKITLPAGVVGRKFDDEKLHGLSHCMKAVDFIVDMGDRILFIEIKDPDDPQAKLNGGGDKFYKELQSGKIDLRLSAKYRDSWLYETAEGRNTKPVHYLILIGSSGLSAPELLTRTEALKRQIPFNGPSGRAWEKPFVSSCVVMNLASWNKAMPKMPVSRVVVSVT